MIEVAEILTAKVLAEITWRCVKEGLSITKNLIREPLKKFALTEDELNILAESMNKAQNSCSTPTEIEQLIKSNDAIKKIIKKVQKNEYNAKNQYIQNNVYGNNTMNCKGPRNG